MFVLLRPFLHAVGLWLAVLPFLLVALIAPGVMPARDGNGTLTLVLCADGATTEMQVDLATGQPVQPGPDAADDRCDWAAGHWATADLARPTLPSLVWAMRPADPRAAQTLVLAGAAATGLPPATGPPAAV